MNFFISTRSFLASLVCFTGAVFAEEEGLKEEKPSRFTVRHIEEGGIGYNQGYTTFGLFLTLDPNRNSVLPFIDLRGHVFDDGKPAANAGLGVRVFSGCRVYGVNAYYDYRKTSQQHYNQVGLGLESLGVRWDFRLNGYLPVGDKTGYDYKTTSITEPVFTAFQGQQALMSQTMTQLKTKQYAMKGLNAEAAFHILKSKNIDFYAALGPYYYNYHAKQAIGGQARLGAQIYEYLSLEVINSYDSKFHENFQGSIGLQIPFGPKPKSAKKRKEEKCASASFLSKRAVQEVKRQEIIVTDKTKKTLVSEISSTAINPLTNEPYVFVFVDNTSNSAGTFESPYPSLTIAELSSNPGDIIYVFPGDGTTKGMDAGIALKDKQQLWGSETSLPLQTTEGTLTIPSFTTTAPKITNIAGDGITLAIDNKIGGLTLLEAMGNGIVGVNPNDLEITSCTIEQSKLDQIHLEYTGSSGSVSLDNLTVINGEEKAVFIDASVNGMVCSISNCTIQDNAESAIEVMFLDEAIFNLSNSTLSSNGGSSDISMLGTLTVSNNTFSDSLSNTVAPLLVTAGEGSFSGTVEGNVITDNACGAIHFILNDTTLANITLSNNKVTENGVGDVEAPAIYIDANSTETGNCTLTLEDNTFTGNSGIGLYCANGSFDQFQVTAIGNEVSDNDFEAFVFNNPSNTFSLTATDNTISSGLGDAISTRSGIIIADANVELSRNTIDGNGYGISGISLNHEGTTLNLTVENSEIINNGLYGIAIIPSGLISDVTVKIDGNKINENANATQFTLQGTSTLTVTNNEFKGNTSVSERPLSIVLGSNPFTATIEGNTISENATGSMLFLLSDIELATLNINNNSVMNNGSGSISPFYASAVYIYLDGTNSNNCVLNLGNNTFSNNAGSGFYCDGGAFNELEVIATNNSITDNQGSGLAFGPSINTFTFTATGNTITGGGDNGIATTGDMSLGSFTLSNNKISQNSTNGANGLAISGPITNLTLSMDHNEINDNDGSGILLYTSSPIDTLKIAMESNTVNGNVNSGANLTGGVDIEQFINCTGSFTHNTLLGNSGDGLSISSTDPSGSICVTMVGNVSENYSLSNGSGVFNLAPCDVGSVNDGIFVTSDVTLVISCEEGEACPP